MGLSVSVIWLSITLGMLALGSAALLAHRSQRLDQTVFLGVFLGLYGLIKLDELFIGSLGYISFPHLLGAAFGLKLFLAPAVYFYTRSLTAPKAKWLGKHDWPALLAPLAAFCVALPFYALPAADKIALMSPDTRDPQLYANALLGCQIGFGLFLLTSLAYLAATGRLFKLHTQRLKALFSRIDNKTHNWLRWTILILALGWTLHSISEIWAIQGSRPPAIAATLNFIEMCWIGIFAFFGLRHHLSTPAGADSRHDTPVPAETSGVALLEPGRMSEITSRLHQVMVAQELFTDPELSLTDLAAAVGVRNNHLSETFSRQLDCNFFDFVNGYRVEKARDLLVESNDTILMIAFDAGFNSRSTFNAAFKKLTGMTPSAYRGSQLGAGLPRHAVDGAATKLAQS